MKTVLVTRAAGPAAEFRAALLRHGIASECVAVIEIGPPDDWSPCDAALATIDEYDALVFTSGNGVRWFVERMARAGRTCDDMPAGFGLGAKTQEVMRDCGLTVVDTPPAQNAADLAEEVCMSLTHAGFPGVEGMRFLFPCGDKAREELPAALRVHGAVVDEIVVYSNRPAPASTTDAIRPKLERGEFAAVCFFAPSQVSAFLELFPGVATSASSPIVAAIGGTTAAALEAAGVHPAVVSSSPDVEIFAAEIAAALG